MRNAVLQLRILFISGGITISLGLLTWSLGYEYGVVPLGLGIFFIGPLLFTFNNIFVTGEDRL